MQPKEPWEECYDEHFGAISDTGNYDAEVKAFIRQTVLEALGDVNVEKKEHKQGQALMTRAYNQEGRGFNSAVDAYEEKKDEVRKRFSL